MSYTLIVSRVAERELGRLPSQIHDRISRRIHSLSDNPRPRGTRKLKGVEQYRIRVGDYRILYTIDDPGNLVTINFVEHRREAYR